MCVSVCVCFVCVCVCVYKCVGGEKGGSSGRRQIHNGWRHSFKENKNKKGDERGSMRTNRGRRERVRKAFFNLLCYALLSINVLMFG